MSALATTLRSLLRSSTAVFLATMFTAPPASADEAHLAWGECAAEGGLPETTFACNTNTGTHTLVASFVLDETLAVPGTWSLIANLDLGTIGTATTLPDWWRVSADGCRPGAFSVSYDFLSDPQTACFDPYLGQALASPSVFQIITTPDLPPHGSSTYGRYSVRADVLAPATFEAGVEYSAFRVTVLHSRTVGPDACTGCCDLVTLAVTLMVLGSETSGRQFLNQPAVSWQGEGAGCGPTASRPRSWGQIRSLYR
jgi:hypothetical protein